MVTIATMAKRKAVVQSDSDDEDDLGEDSNTSLVLRYAAHSSFMMMCMMTTICLHYVALGSRSGGRSFLRPRRRGHIETIISETGDYYFRRMYRMNQDMFKGIVRLLSPGLSKGTRWVGPNGRIPKDLRVSAALRYFAGGSPYDIALTHGISHSFP